jgi:hypothetical protein
MKPRRPWWWNVRLVFRFRLLRCGRCGEAVEFGRPRSRDVVTFGGIDIFGTPADALVMKLREITSVDVDEDGHSATAPALLLWLWRSVVPENDDDQDGRYFDSVLVARPGYYG